MVGVMAVAGSIDWLWDDPDSIVILLRVPWTMSLLGLRNACRCILNIKINTEIRNEVVLLWSISSLGWGENMIELFLSLSEVLLLVQDLSINSEVRHWVVHLDLLAVGFWMQILGNFTEGRGDWVRS